MLSKGHTGRLTAQGSWSGASTWLNKVFLRLDEVEYLVVRINMVDMIELVCFRDTSDQRLHSMSIMFKYSNWLIVV